MQQLTTQAMRARIERLEALARGLAKEVALWRGRGPPLLAGELRGYLQGLQDAIAGLDAGRVALGSALDRIERTGEPVALHPGRRRTEEANDCELPHRHGQKQ
jgi:hypothetical protein